MNDWTPDSWQGKTATQQASYPSEQALRENLAQLAQLPPLVTSWEIDALKAQLAAAQRGEAFLLQGGDCAENFADCSAPMDEGFRAVSSVPVDEGFPHPPASRTTLKKVPVRISEICFTTSTSCP